MNNVLKNSRDEFLNGSSSGVIPKEIVFVFVFAFLKVPKSCVKNLSVVFVLKFLGLTLREVFLKYFFFIQRIYKKKICRVLRGIAWGILGGL